MKKSLPILLACIALGIAFGLTVHPRKANAVITLTTAATITAPAIRATVFNCQVPANDSTLTQCFISYVYSDSLGNPLPGFQGGTSTVLSNTDLNLLISTPGSVRARIQASLQNNLGSLAAGTTN